MTIQQALLSAISRLRSKTGSANLDSEVLLSAVLNKPRGFLLAHPEKKISSSSAKKFSLLINKRLHSAPVAYLIGHKEFYGLDFRINKNTLIPRPETEILVEEAIKIGRRLSAINIKPNIIDVGTGSGCIAITLAKYLPKAKIMATDISEKAIAVAKQNAKMHKVSERIKFIRGNLVSPFLKGNRILKGMRQSLDCRLNKVDLLLANLPYLTTDELANVPHEPKTALHGGKLGLELIERLLSQSPAILSDGGIILLEIAPTQVSAVGYFVEKYLPGKKVAFIKDLSGRDRVAKIY